jgi:hypothetical protein
MTNQERCFWVVQKDLCPFGLSKLRIILKSREVYFTDIIVQNKPIILGEQVNGRILLQNPIALTKELTFTYDDHSFSIEFAALEYIAPQRIRYAYQLKDLIMSGL